MKKIKNLDEWGLEENIQDAKHSADVSIIFKYPDPKALIALTPKERIISINLDQLSKLAQLKALNLLDTYEITGTKKQPRGVKAKVGYPVLAKLDELDFIESIWIESIDHATKIEVKEPEGDKYFCVRMTVIIEVEGTTRRKQGIEERFVLIKASSHEDAYERLDKRKSDYAEPYLNSAGRLVSWRIESFDDCYVTEINNPHDLDKPEGVEVYSKLGSRKAPKRNS
ncbi:MAG: DUF4288 domain-containing protein [Mucilaginibacter sp.]